MTTPRTPASDPGDSTASGPVPVAPVASPPAPVAPVAPVAVTTRRKGGGWLNLLLGAAAILAVGGVAFAIGRTTAPAAAFAVTPGDGGFVLTPGGSFDPGSGPIVRGGGPGLLGAGGPTIDGTVTAIDGDSVTVQLDSGDEMTFDLDDETTWHESTDTDATAVQVGDEVAVRANGGRPSTSGADGAPNQGGSPSLTAGDVTVRR